VPLKETVSFFFAFIIAFASGAIAEMTIISAFLTFIRPRGIDKKIIPLFVSTSAPV